MRSVRLGRTGVEVPALSLGTWPFGGPNVVGGVRSVGWSGHDDTAASAALREAHAQGITHWDTADVYGDGRSERLIGRSWGDVPRDEVFLATKVGWDPGEFKGYYHPTQIRRRLERSLENLRVERIDLYYLHHCDFGPDDERLDEALELVRRFRDEGKIRFVGLSDWECAKVARLYERVDPDVVQVYRNVAADTYASSGLKQKVEATNAGVAFFSPIRHGLLLGKYEEPVEWPEGDFRRNVSGFGDAELLATLRSKAALLRERFAASPQPVLQALLGALLTDAPTGCVLLGQRSPDQVRAAAAAAEPLSYDDASWVRDLYADLEV